MIPNQAKPVLDKRCSGGTKVVKIGNRADNYLEFRDVYAKKKGSYNLTLHYSCSDSRDVQILVNGETLEIKNLISDEVATKTMKVKLKKGYNTIQISNEKAFAPDLDKISLNLN